MDQKTWLENILIRRHFDETPAKVLDFKMCAAVGKGENYLSLVKRINATILLGSGEKRNIRLIVKDGHRDPKMKKMTAQGSFFEKEITMYRDILPKMENLINEMNSPIEPLWPKCYGFKLYDQLVFEDLMARGYKMVDRKLQQDLAHSRLVFSKLGQLHSLSKILLERSEIPPAVFGQNMWSKPELVSNVFERSTTSLAEEIDSWGDEWKEISARFKTAKSGLRSRLVDALAAKPSDFLVLNHGDCWSNNVMFKNDMEGHPISLIFIDFQVSSIGSPVYDLHYFVSTSVRPEVYKEHSTELLRAYCDSLRTNLAALNYEGAVPDVEELRTKMDETRILKLCFGITLTPLVVGDNEDVPDLEEVVKEEPTEKETKKAFDSYRNLNDRARDFLKNLVNEAAEAGLI